MTDALTDAVRRIKGLQADIERLKAAQDEEGEPRLFFVEDELVTVANTVTLDCGGLEDDAVYGDATYQTTTVDLIERVRPEVDDVAVVTDAQALTSAALTDNGFYNDGTYQQTSIDAVAIVRDITVDRAAAIDSQALRSTTINTSGVYGDAGTGYQITTYNVT
jgi:hypothetical protein